MRRVLVRDDLLDRLRYFCACWLSLHPKAFLVLVVVQDFDVEPRIAARTEHGSHCLLCRLSVLDTREGVRFALVPPHASTSDTSTTAAAGTASSSGCPSAAGTTAATASATAATAASPAAGAAGGCFA